MQTQMPSVCLIICVQNNTPTSHKDYRDERAVAKTHGQVSIYPRGRSRVSPGNKAELVSGIGSVSLRVEVARTPSCFGWSAMLRLNSFSWNIKQLRQSFRPSADRDNLTSPSSRDLSIRMLSRKSKKIDCSTLKETICYRQL